MGTADSLARRRPGWFTAGFDALARPLGWVATALYVGWQVMVEQKLFLHTFLVARMGRRGVPTLPLGYGNVLALKGVMLWRQLSGHPDALQPARQRVYTRIHRRLQERGLP
jgi:hypothetical protein